MSNKPKNINRLVSYDKTPGEIRHDNLVNNATNYAHNHRGFNNHQGSKPHYALSQKHN